MQLFSMVGFNVVFRAETLGQFLILNIWHNMKFIVSDLLDLLFLQTLSWISGYTNVVGVIHTERLSIVPYFRIYFILE
jgi:hypothetical protein